jgi:hypothetical protein
MSLTSYDRDVACNLYKNYKKKKVKRTLSPERDFAWKERMNIVHVHGKTI